ncbi:MAG: hypothetical protein ACTHLB_03750 [Parafilimonas sp.]
MKQSIKHAVMAAGFLFASLITFAQKSADDFSGTWKTNEGKTVIISKTANGFIGEAQKGDKKFTVLDNISFHNNKWTAAIIRPKDGMVAACELLLNDNKLNLSVHKGPFSKKIIWTKQ